MEVPSRSVLAAFALAASVAAMARPPNYDVAKIGTYTLADPLVFENGERLTSPAQWPARRAEIVRIFEREMFGRTPPPPEAVECELKEEGVTCRGLGIRRQYRMWFKKDRTGPFVDWIVFLPNRISGLKPKFEGGRPVCENRGKVPVILFLNYNGNHELTTDAEVPVPEGAWVRDHGGDGVRSNAPDPSVRGRLRSTSNVTIFPLEQILARGYAVMSACYAQISPDVEVRHGDKEELAYTGVFSLWPKRDESATDNITAIGAWAWTLSRGLDLAYTIPEIDARKNVATGCSRLAKTPLLACSRDERFAVCVPTQTGGGGVPLAKRNYGENVSTEMAYFPHWYCKAYGKYIDNEGELPFDQHLLVASIAPRAILVEGFNEGWFDTEGEYLSCRAASSAWSFLGKPGLPEGDFPDNYDTSLIGPYLGYVRRGGLHGITGHDWNWTLDFADQALARFAR